MSRPTDENHDAEADRVIARALNQDVEADAIEPIGTAEERNRVDQIDDDTFEAIEEYRTVLSHLATDEVEPPAGFEDRVVAAALARRPAAIPALDTMRARRRTARWVSVAAAGIAAAVIVGLLITGGSNGTGAPTGRVVTVGATQSDLADVLAASGTRTGALRLTPPAGARDAVGLVALAADGRGYVYDVSARLPDGDAWLWLETADPDVHVRVGRLSRGRAPNAFVVTGTVSQVTGAFLTNESAGTTPTRPSDVIARATLSP